MVRPTEAVAREVAVMAAVKLGEAALGAEGMEVGASAEVEMEVGARAWAA